MTWRLVDHTADVAIECDAPDTGAALADAGTALTSVLTGAPDPRFFVPDAELEIAVEAPDEQALVVAWLSELLWLLESRDLLWLSGGVEVGGAAAGGFRLQALGNVVRYDPQKHGRGTEVKAVTYHDLALEHAAGGRHLRVVLDI